MDHSQPFDPDHAGWTGDHELQPAVGFDFETVYRSLDGEHGGKPARRQEIVSATAEALNRILDWLVLPSKNFESQPTAIAEKPNKMVS